MKKRILLTTLVAGLIYVTFTSESGGPAFYGSTGGGNRTGALASVTNCSGSVGAVSCHGSGTSTTVTITVDSGTTSVTHYKPGVTYKVKVHGTNTASLPKFGFEFAAVSGLGGSQVQAGSFPSPPTSLSADSYLGILFMEHTHSLTAATPGVYDTSFQWIAPATNMGTLTLYCTINAVNGNTSADAGDISGNDSLKLLSWAALETPAIMDNLSINAFPSPTTTNFNLQLENAQPGIYTLQIFNMNGSVITSQNVAVINAIETASINTSNWPAGLYNVVVEKDGNKKSLIVVKQ